MSAQGLEGIDRTVQQTHIWINELADALNWDSPRSYRLLRAVLHALRDFLPVNESANLAAQLPTLIRGVYYEQWRPNLLTAKQRSCRHFIAQINDEFRSDPLEDTRGAIGAALQLLASKVSAGEIRDVQQNLSPEIRSLWPSPREMV